MRRGKQGIERRRISLSEGPEGKANTMPSRVRKRVEAGGEKGKEKEEGRKRERKWRSNG